MSKKSRIPISNMHCTNCSGTIERYFNKLDDISCSIILSENEGVFEYDENKWDEKNICKHLKKIGYPRMKDKKNNFDFIKLMMCIILTIPFLIHMILMMFDYHFPSYFKYIELALASVIEILAGVPFFIGMIRDFKNRRLGMDVLVSLGTLTAYIYSLIILILKLENTLYFETCGMLLTIILLGKYIEKKAKNKTGSSLKVLMSLQEKSAKVLIDDKIEIKEISNINIGVIIILSHGERIPLDATVIEGTLEVDESMITGESLPVVKNIGDNILSGTIIISGNAKAKTNKLIDDTYLSSLIKKVEDIQKSKPKIQRLADKISSFFVPIVILISIIGFIATYFKTHEINTSIIRGIGILMISCPCSLGLATPLSILVGSSRAIKLGIIYNNTEIFEKASHIDTICFDKTGTLSSGTFEVIEFFKYKDDALDIIYTLESISNHPIAKSLVDYALKNNAKLINDLNPYEVLGKGVYASDYFIYKENDIVILKEKDNIIAKIIVKDKIKEEAYNVISELYNKKIDVYMLTGDSKSIALNTAVDLGIKEENVFYEIKPEDKLSIIKEIQSNNRNVMFVGDGINDALALNKSDMSVSMGSGSDVAMNSSDIILSNNDLNSLYKSITLSRYVYKNIIQNFIWAFSYNLIAIPLAFFGILNPIVCGISMAFSNITVVLNALRLSKIKLNKKENKND